MSKKWQQTDTAVDGTPLMLVSQTGSYVSEAGRVYSHRLVPVGEHVNQGGYMTYINKMPSGKWQNFRSHRTVAFAFCDKPEGCDVVNHKNGVRTDNRPENLEWTTPSGNQRHSYSTGLKSRAMSKQQVVEARDMYTNGESIRDIAKKMGVSYAVAFRAVSGRGYADVGHTHKRERTGNKRLSFAHVYHIKCLLVMGWRPIDIAAEVGLDRMFVTNIKAGKSYYA